MRVGMLAAGMVLGSVVGLARGGFVVTFDSLSGYSNGAEFISTTEGGFTVTSLDGDWNVGQAYGHPTPSIFCRSDVGVVEVIDVATGLFTLASLDLADATTGLGGSADYQIDGLLDGVLVFTASGTVPSEFTTVASPSAETIDQLLVTMTRRSASFNIDNIVVESVPAPSGLAVFCLLGIAGHRRR